MNCDFCIKIIFKMKEKKIYKILKKIIFGWVKFKVGKYLKMVWIKK